MLEKWKLSLENKVFAGGVSINGFKLSIPH